VKYTVTAYGRTFQVDVDGDRVTVDGRPMSVELDGVPRTPLRQLVLDGASRLVALSREPEGWTVQLGGERVTAVVEDERTHALREMTGQSHHQGTGGVILAPMPGLVLRVEVEEGQVVEAGAGVVVLEAMKMENEITTPGAGVVSSVRVSPGDAVEKGAPLVEVRAQPDP
jgi:biotin carboxyl carrier protein